jgi:hypothetical protein
LPEKRNKSYFYIKDRAPVGVLKSDTSPMKNVFMAAIEKAVGAVPGGASVQVEITLLGM